MHPKALLDCAAELVQLVLKFDHPVDAVVSGYVRQHRLGTRERATLATTVYNVLRQKSFYTYLAQHGSGGMERRLAILGFSGGVKTTSVLEAATKPVAKPVTTRSRANKPMPVITGIERGFLVSALSELEKKWLFACDQVQQDDLLDLHRHNLPAWLAESLKAQLGEHFWGLVATLNTPAGLDLRVNILKEKRQDVQAELAKHAIESIATPYSPWGLRLQGKPSLNQLDVFKRGAIEVQDEGSQLLALLLNAKRSEMVVDFCAGAGGKTLAVGACMRNTGRLYALDTSAHRLDGLKPRLARSGLSNVHSVVIAHERDDRIQRLAGKMDRVLVDAPCSGLGTLRRNPDLKWRQTPKTVAALNLQQAAILQNAARLLKPGGRLVYATCSLLESENEAIAQQFSADHPDFNQLEAAEILSSLGVQAADTLCAGPYLRLWPHVHGTDGFFAAVWQKT